VVTSAKSRAVTERNTGAVFSFRPAPVYPQALDKLRGEPLTCEFASKILSGEIQFNSMSVNYSGQTPLWPWIVVIFCAAVVAAGTLTLMCWIGLALLGY
jgi:hypothetical protein